MVHIDGDALVYIAGFAADSRNGPFRNSAHNAKLIIGKILKETKQTEFKIFLTSKNPEVNFRTELLSTYKKNRVKPCNKCNGKNITPESYVEYMENADGIAAKRRMHTCKDCGNGIPSTKPVYYNRIRQYLIERHNAIVCKWGEADDWLGVGRPKWIATHDKDIYQLGKTSFYNMKSGEILHIKDILGKIYIKETQQKNRAGELKFTKKGKPILKKEIKGYGFKWFCIQMITGDKVDNIIKIKSGDGPVWIHKVFEPLTSALEYWNMVKFYYHGTGNDDKLWEMAQLLWISRTPRQRCTPETIEEIINA